MYFDLSKILRVGKESIHPEHWNLDIWDYFDCRTGEVLEFTSFQKYYIQEHFNFEDDLFQEDLEDYRRHEEINGNYHHWDDRGVRAVLPEHWKPRESNSITAPATNEH